MQALEDAFCVFVRLRRQRCLEHSLTEQVVVEKSLDYGINAITWPTLEANVTVHFLAVIVRNSECFERNAHSDRVFFDERVRRSQKLINLNQIAGVMLI